MESDNALNVQNSFFNQVRKDHARVSVALNSGQRISGFVKSFDKYTLLLGTKNGEQIVFKHAIATVSIQKAPDRRNGQEPPEKGFGNFIEFERKDE